MTYLLALGLSFGLAAVLTPFVRRTAVSLNIVDYPQPRKIHAQPIPLLGGLAVFLAFLLTTGFFWWRGLLIDGRITNQALIALLLGGFILIVGGILDDRYQLKPQQQIIFPVLAIIPVIFSGISIHVVTNPFGGVYGLATGWGIILAIGWLLGMMYTTKLLDGLDGLTSGVTVIGALIIFVVSLFWDIPQSGTSLLALTLAGSCLGFLLYNWHPATIFLGEGGSVFCGFVLGVLAIISGSKIATALLIMGIPILDIIWVVIRRLWWGASPVGGDRRHLHFRLLDIGLSQRQAVLLLYFLSAGFGLSSLALDTRGKIIALGILLLVMIIIIGGLVIVYRKKVTKLDEKH